MMNFVFKTRICVLKMVNFAEELLHHAPIEDVISYFEES